MSANKIELDIIAISHSVSQSHSYAVVLGETNGVRKIPIIIGGFEAQAIAVALERMTPSRPLTHDLMRNLMTAFSIKLLEVIIYKLEEGIFYSKLICQSTDGRVEIDSRTSDALAIAVRFNAPIFTNEKILLEAGSLMEELSTPVGHSKIEPIEKNTNNFNKLSIKDLEELLNQVLEQEDYIQAAKIRDEINTRTKK